MAGTLQRHSVYIQRSSGIETIMLAKTLSLFLAAFLVISIPHPAEARRDDQGGAREGVQKGKLKSLRQIEATVLPRMKGMKYLGPEFDSRAKVYRLKFIDKDRVRFVDVDARTGRIIRQR